jgi:hypothetical protein
MMPCYARLLVALLCALALREGYRSGVPIVHAAKSESTLQTLQAPFSDFIKSLQRELKRAGYDPGMTDGKLGPATRQALRRFQEANDLSPTGAPDIPTLTTLLRHSLPH